MLTLRPHGSATTRRCAGPAKRAIGALFAAMSVALTGCFFEGGPGWSADRFAYESTSWQPKTVSLIDTRNGETLWSVDVPVEQRLVVSFVPGEGEGDRTPDLMKWQLFKAGARFGNLENRMPVPNKDSRLLQLALRPRPEMPGAILTNRGPTAPEEVFVPIDEPLAPVDEDDPFAAPEDEEPMMGEPGETPEPEPVPIDVDEPTR